MFTDESPLIIIEKEDEKNEDSSKEEIISPKKVNSNGNENCETISTKKTIGEVDQDQIQETVQIKSSISNLKKNTVKPNPLKPLTEFIVKNNDKVQPQPSIQVETEPVVKNKTEQEKKIESVEGIQKNMKAKNTTGSDEFAIAKVEGKKVITYSRKDRKPAEMKRKSPVIEQVKCVLILLSEVSKQLCILC